MNTEKMLNHLKNLEEKHYLLEKQISQGFSHYLDDSSLSKIKFEKLEVKKEIETIKQKYNESKIK